LPAVSASSPSGRAEGEAHGREYAVLKIVFAARGKSLEEGSGQHMRRREGQAMSMM
jgi:hypothetical protein